MAFHPRACPTPAPAREASCEYRFKNPSLGKTLMINQAADPSAAAGSGRGARGRAGARRRGVAFRASEESRSRRRRAGRALAACSRGRAGASRRGRRRRRAGYGGRGLCGLRSPDVRRRRPRPERAAWGPRWPRRWAPSTTWHFSCNSAAPRDPQAMRPGTTTSPDTVSLRAAPTDFPPLNPTPVAAAPTWRSRCSNLRRLMLWPRVPGRPLLGLGTHPVSYRGQLCEKGFPRAHSLWPQLAEDPLHARTHSHGYTHLCDHTDVSNRGHTQPRSLHPTLTTLHIPSEPLLAGKYTCAHYAHESDTGWWLTLPAGTRAHTLRFATTLACLPADTDTHARTHLCTHFAHPLLSAPIPFSFVGLTLKLLLHPLHQDPSLPRPGMVLRGTRCCCLRPASLGGSFLCHPCGWVASRGRDSLGIRR